jgi:hypothetical protein
MMGLLALVRWQEKRVDVTRQCQVQNFKLQMSGISCLANLLVILGRS